MFLLSFIHNYVVSVTPFHGRCTHCRVGLSLDHVVQRNLQFHGHHSYFGKDFQMLLTLKEGHT